MEAIQKLLNDVLNKEFVQAILSNPRKKDGVLKIKVRPVEMRGKRIYQLESFTKTQAAMLDIVKGAFSLGDKYISFYASDSDLVRITGYLVKRSEMEKYYEGEAVLQNTVYLGGDNYRNAHLENRKVRAL